MTHHLQIVCVHSSLANSASEHSLQYDPTNCMWNRTRATDIHWRLVFLASGCMDISVCGGGWRQLKAWECLQKKKRQRDEWEGEREVFWPLVAFTTQAQIIEGHGNLSDRWTMLPFCSPLWTGPSITGGEINSIHQLFVSLGPLMPPDIAQRGLINVCGLELSLLAWHWIKTLLFTLCGTLVFCQQPACQFCHNSDQDEFLWRGKCLPKGAIT